MEIQIPVLDNAECKRAFANKKAVIDDRIICAGSLAGGKDACQVLIKIIIFYYTMYL
jgi:hypothetical protein